jgi:hypothetical protein
LVESKKMFRRMRDPGWPSGCSGSLVKWTATA